MTRSIERCPCGKPLHYPNRTTRAYMTTMIRRFGPLVRKRSIEGTYRVPRHYAALHDLLPWDLKRLAELYGWERVDDDDDET